MSIDFILCVASFLSRIPLGHGESSLVLVEDFRERRGASKSLVVTAEDIRKRVARAGGNIEGVVVASLSWSSPDDLDLHVKTPGGAEISYSNKRAAGGELDVDMCVHGRHSGKCTANPVENIVFSDEAAQGRYEIYVQNFNYHPDVRSRALQVSDVLEGKRPSKENMELRYSRNKPVLFEVLVKIEGTHRVFSGLCTPPGKTHASSNVQVFAFEYFPHALTDEGRVMPVFEAGSDPTCDAFKQKLLGSDSGRRKAIEGSSSAKDRVAGASAGGVSGASRASKAAGAAPSRRKANKHTRALARAKDAALEAVRASSRETLLAKPPKALRELLTDLGAMCRGCLDKAEIVDRLQEVAGVAGRAEL